MKDYKHIEHMRNLNDSLIWERMKRCYDYGYEDGLGKAQTDSYVKGYEDGQKEKPKAIYEMKKECKKTKDPIFYGHCVGECDYAKQTEDEIKVGDEVIVQVDRIGFVTGFDVLFDRVYVTTKDGWSDAFGRSFVKKTGRHFDTIPEVLDQMKG